MSINDLRSLLDYLASLGQLVHIGTTVDKDLELGQAASKHAGGPAVYFERVKGYSVPVVTGLYWNINNIARMLNCRTARELVDKFSCAMRARVKPLVVDDGPVKEQIITKNIDLQRMFPIPWHCQRDAGPFITAGVAVSKDPETGIRSQSIHRMQVKGPNKTGFVVAKGTGRHMERMLASAASRNRSLEVAVVLGLDPWNMLASQVSGREAPYPTDKYELAGALQNRAIELVRCETVDLEVPANAEIVLEGEILPNVLEDEGPFTELTGLCDGSPSQANVFMVRAVTHRENPIYQTILGGGGQFENPVLKSVSYSASACKFIRDSVPSITALNVSANSACMHAYVSIKKELEGQQRNAIISTFASFPDLKLVVVVDDDVDVFNLQDVEWALAMRFQGDRDILVIPGARGHDIDPSADSGLGCKVGVDATARLGGRASQKRVQYEHVASSSDRVER